MTDLQAKLLVAFDSEYRSIIETIRATVIKVESSGEKLEGAALNEAFRMAHTLKGSAHVVGLTKVVTLGHRLESLFARVREGKVTLGVNELRLVHSALGMIEDLVAAFHGGQVEPDPAPIVEAIEAVMNSGVPKVDARPAPLLAVVPAEPVVAPVKAPPAAAAASNDVVIAEGETLRLSARHLDQLLDTSGELLSLIRGGRDIDQKISRLSGHVESVVREWDLLRRTSGGVLQTMSHVPEYARVAQFLDFVGTQLGPISKNLRAARAAAKQSDWDFLNLGEQLQEDVRRARTVPAETVFGGFYKMVRDISGELERPVDFRLTGLEVAADRGVLQALKDPMMHMLRNSIGHGIEAATVRRDLGKDPVGKLNVRLSLNDGRLHVTINDDGQGLNETKIRERALGAGLITPAALEVLPSERVFDFIFSPGLSTAAEVTDLSGRGMGMSVVIEAIKKLQGSISIQSQAGRGTTFTISVPVTLTNHHLVLVKLDDQTFALPSANIESLRRVKPAEVSVVDGQRVVMIEGAPVPLVDLGTLIDEPHAPATAADESLAVVILRVDERRMAVVVDAILDKRETLIKNLNPGLQRLRLFTGAITQGDGSVTLVLSPATLLAKGARERGVAPAGARPRTQAARVRRATPRILVVDDSITTRTLERGILEANGFEVSLAVDGVDALAKLSLESYDLVISDVEMPRMDGFTLVGEIKKSPKFKHLPVIMVTSLEKPADRERGMSLGANAYVLKQKFDQGGLLEIIRGIL